MSANAQSVYVAPGGVYIGAGPVYVIPAPNQAPAPYAAPTYYGAPGAIAPGPVVVAPTTAYESDTGYYDTGYYESGYYDAPGYYDDQYADQGVVAEVPVPVGDDSASYCAQRYRSYDPASGTYLGFDGLRHPCP